MPKFYACSYCEEIKPVSDFPIDKRNACGHTIDQCKACKNEAAAEIINCKRCGSHVRKDSLQRHMQSTKCLEHDKPWKKFSSIGSKKVYCPCDKCKANHYKVSEKTAYQHLKYGAITRAKGKTEVERKAAKREAASKIVSCDNCGRHVRNDCIHKHKKTLKCIEYGEDQPWKKFNSGGTKKVYCPCDRCKLVDYKISEKSAYRHLKHGHVERPESDRDRERTADMERQKQEIFRQATREWMKRCDEERDL